MESKLNRFIDAQSLRFESVIAELRQGRKAGHWMWYIFPQLGGLGYSATSRKYAIRDEEEAVAYLADSILGNRLIECTSIVLDLDGSTAEEIFGYPDVLKFHSSLTLFDSISENESVFSKALDKYYRGGRDGRTLELLRS